MQYFTEDYLNFFKELRKNNNRDWFHKQKKRYEVSVKNPFTHFITAVIEEIQKQQTLNADAKDCILRINRDIRFSKDKTPYNLHQTAFVSSGGRKNKSIPGIFLRLSADMVGIMGGCYGPDKDQLVAIRKAIMQDGKPLHKIISSTSFKDKFGEVRGDKMKRIPKEYQPAAEDDPLIIHKQFYVMAEEDPAIITSENLLKIIMDYNQVLRPFNDYLVKAIQK